MSDPYDDQYKYPPPEKMIDKITERREREVLSIRRDAPAGTALTPCAVMTAAASVCEAIVWGTVKIWALVEEEGSGRMWLVDYTDFEFCDPARWVTEINIPAAVPVDTSLPRKDLEQALQGMAEEKLRAMGSVFAPGDRVVQKPAPTGWRSDAPPINVAVQVMYSGGDGSVFTAIRVWNGRHWTHDTGEPVIVQMTDVRWRIP